MTMRFVPTTAIAGSSDTAVRVIFAWFDFMRQASPTGPGWTVPRSSDGVTVVTDGSGSNIVDYTDLKQWIAATSISWFILRSPDGAKEIMWSRFNAGTDEWQVRYSNTAAFIGGDITVVPTAVDSNFYHQVRAGSSSGAVMHMGADDAAPYGYFMYGHASGIFATTRAGWTYIPVTATPNDDIDPYVHFMVNINTGGDFILADLWDENNGSTFTRCVASIPGEGTSNTCPALAYQNSGGTMIPNKVPLDGNNDDLSFPIVFGRSTDEVNSGYKGISTFMQWNGTLRGAGETFASRTRVSWGDVNFPWDGSTPSAT